MDCILWIVHYVLYTMDCILCAVCYGIPLEKLLFSYHYGALRNLLYQLQTYYKTQMSKLSPELNLRVRLYLLTRLSHLRNATERYCQRSCVCLTEVKRVKTNNKIQRIPSSIPTKCSKIIGQTCRFMRLDPPDKLWLLLF